MGNIFGASEVVELAVQIERNGKDFYTALADRLPNPKARDVFTYLAAQEERHMAVFQEMRGHLHRYEPPESYPGEYISYMRALASEHIFTQGGKGKEVAGRVASESEAMDLAIGFENDSIVFYTGMTKVVPDHDHPVIEAIIAEERKHLAQLMEMKEKI